jgi:hypothetical protein
VVSPAPTGSDENHGSNGSPRGVPAVFRCFRCFSMKLSASAISFLAEILGERWFADLKNSEIPRCFFAVSRCSFDLDAIIAI